MSSNFIAAILAGWSRTPQEPRLSNRGGRRLTLEQHRIAVAEEAIAVADGVRVCAADRLKAVESRDQHQQRRPWQVEISPQPVDDAESESRRDEQLGLGGAGVYAT